MQIFLHGKPVAALTPKQQKNIHVTKFQPEAAGVVLSTEDATRRIEKGTRFLIAVLAGFAVLMLGGLLMGLLLSDDSFDRNPLIAAVIAGGILIAALLVYFHGWRRQRWQRSLDGRLADLPAAGTPVRTDAISLVVGAQTFAWSDIVISKVVIQGDGGGDGAPEAYRIERLVLDAAGTAVALDTPMIENGRCLIDQICRRLAPRLGSSP